MAAHCSIGNVDGGVERDVAHGLGARLPVSTQSPHSPHKSPTQRGPDSPHPNRESPMNRSLTLQTWGDCPADSAVADSAADDQRHHPATASNCATVCSIDIARSSSYSQRLSGPVMVVPYRKSGARPGSSMRKLNKRYQETGEERGRLYFLPERFELDGNVQTELRFPRHLRGATVPRRQPHQRQFFGPGATGHQGRFRRLPV